MSEEFYIVDQAWKSATPEEREQAKAHLTSLLDVVPLRAPGELVYVLAFLGDEPKGSHVTLLGPTYFPSEESCFKFFSAVRELTGESRKIEVNILDELKLPSKSGSEHIVHRVEVTDELNRLHEQLVHQAKSLGATLLEEQYTKENFLPHVTHHLGCKLKQGSTFELDHVAFSVHPGAKLNISASEVKGNFRLRD